MLSSFNENKLCDQMIELELMIEYRNFKESLVLLQKILQDHPDYLPAKEALHQVYRQTGQSKRAHDLQREIDDHIELKAKASLSDSAKEEYVKIESRKFAEKIEQLTKVIYQGRNIEEILKCTAQELLDDLKADRCHIYLASG
jgi:lipopolysaccharide biosynthesis regulator YciM